MNENFIEKSIFGAISVVVVRSDEHVRICCIDFITTTFRFNAGQKSCKLLFCFATTETGNNKQFGEGVEGYVRDDDAGRKS